MKRQCILLFTLFTTAFLLIQIAAVPHVADTLQLQTHQVNIVEPGADPAQWRFDPQRVRIAIGDTVRWTNTGTHLHTVTADDASFDATLDPGQSFEHTFIELGNVPYHDTLNPTLTGRVVVQALTNPTATDAPTQAPIVATATAGPTQTPVVVTATPAPTQTPIVVTATPLPPTQTPIVVTATPVPITLIPLPTLTSLPTNTPTRTATGFIPSTATPTSTSTINVTTPPGTNMALVMLVILLVVGLSVATIYIIQLRGLR